VTRRSCEKDDYVFDLFDGADDVFCTSAWPSEAAAPDSLGCAGERQFMTMLFPAVIIGMIVELLPPTFVMFMCC
jgi:hypothetical protein